MILNTEEVEARLSSPENLSNLLVKQLGVGGKTKGATNIPPLVRKLLAAVEINSGERHVDIAETFGVSNPTISLSSRGLIVDSVDKDLMDTVKDQREKAEDKAEQSSKQAHELALDSLVASLTHLNPKLQNVTSPKELSTIAVNMSKITANLASAKRNEGGVTNNTQVVLFGVQQKKESTFDFIDV